MSATNKPRLLVVGGGIAGTLLATKVSSFMDVTVVDTKEFFEINWANVRSIVEPELLDKINISYKSIPNLGKFLQGTVVKLSEKSATLKDGQVVDFDYVVICTGARYRSAFPKAVVPSLKQRKDEIMDLHKQIKDSRRVLIVGGGPTGVEIAAEIVEAFPGKAVTIVHSGKQLVFETLDEVKGGKTVVHKSRKRVLENVDKFLAKQRIEVLLNRKVTSEGKPNLNSSSKLFDMSDGSSVEADLALFCTGGSPVTDFMQSELAGCVASNGRIEVDASLRVKNGSNVLSHMFAVGDCCNTQETKLGYLAGLHAEMVASNLKVLLTGKGKAKTWTPANGMEGMFLCLGPNDGTGFLSGCVCPSFMVRTIKSKDLFVHECRKKLGLP